MHFMGKLGLEKVSKRSRRDPDHEKTFLTFTLSVNKIILYQFFNVQIIRLYSLGSWNVYVPDNFQT